MAEKCIGSSLKNLPGTCIIIDFVQISRIMITTVNDQNGDLNSFTIEQAGLIANWQAKFDKKAFESDVLTKIVPIDEVANCVQAKEGEIVFAENRHTRTLYKGDNNFTFEIFDHFPEFIAGLQAMEGKNLAFYFVDFNGKVYGKTDGTNFLPIPVEGFNVDEFVFPTGDAGSRVPAKFKIKNNSDLNKAYQVTVLDADGEIIDMSAKLGTNVYGQRTTTNVITGEAVTGCVMDIKTVTLADKDAQPILGIAYAEVVFVDQDGISSNIPLTAAGDITYNAITKFWTINKAALLTTAHTYKLQIKTSGYDIPDSLVVIPE